MMGLDRISGAGVLRTLGLALLIVVPTILAPRADAATIHSTAGGGLWSLGSTWVGGGVPSAGDDVVLDGSVTVQGSVSCSGLEVAAAGRLSNASGAPAALVATGAISNAGTIEDGPGVFRLRFGSDLHNAGTWTNQETILVGAAEHHLTQTPTAIFESHLLRDAAATGDLLVETPFALLGHFNQTGGRAVLSPDCPLTLRAGALTGEVVAQGNEIRFESWSYLDDVEIDAAVLAGEVTVLAGLFTGGLTVLNSLSNVPSFGNGHARIEGGLVNYGDIYNDTYGFTIELAGDLECHGRMLNSFVSLDGTPTQRLRMGPGGEIDTDLHLPEFGTGTIVAETDLWIGDGIALGAGGTMILEPGITLNLAGGSITGGTLTTNGDDIVMDGGGYLGILETDELALQGTAVTTGTTHVSGNVRIAGVLQNWPWESSEITVEGDVVNTGHIRDNEQPIGKTLELRVRGDVLNGGIWENQRVVLDGSQDQLVEIGGGIAVPEFVLAAGFASGSYQWFRDESALPGETSAELEFFGVAGGDAGAYRCEGGEGQVSRTIVFGVNVATYALEPSGAAAFALAPVRPNPLRDAASGAAAIEFTLPAAGFVSLGIFDVAGREVSRLASRAFPAGSHRATWTTNGRSPGVYFVRLEAAGRVASRKVTILE